jgi:hypothetical protein
VRAGLISLYLLLIRAHDVGSSPQSPTNFSFLRYSNSMIGSASLVQCGLESEGPKARAASAGQNYG